ncbi:MAG: lysophospholipid acyltransferase family protein [Bacillota bacterium]|nr:lysophospholipid acyltransferase family protein [Bacillota bacterium]
MKTFRTIMAVLTVFIEFVILSPWMIYCKNLTVKGDEESLKKRDRLAPRLIRFMARGVMWWTGAKVTVTGEENIPDKACVLVGNHQSYFDILSLLACSKTMYGYLAKIEIKKVPFLRTWMDTIDCVFLNRENAKQGLAAIKEAVSLLKRNRSIYIFPEGTRSKCDDIGEFKTGAMMIATKAKAPIVPFLIDGTYKLFEANGNRVSPGEVTITFMPPIYTEDMSREEINAISDKIRDQLIEEQKKQFEKKAEK